MNDSSPSTQMKVGDYVRLVSEDYVGIYKGRGIGKMRVYAVLQDPLDGSDSFADPSDLVLVDSVIGKTGAISGGCEVPTEAEVADRPLSDAIQEVAE